MQNKLTSLRSNQFVYRIAKKRVFDAAAFRTIGREKKKLKYYKILQIIIIF